MRIIEDDKIIPHFEIKIAREPWEIAALKNRVKVILGEK